MLFSVLYSSDKWQQWVPQQKQQSILAWERKQNCEVRLQCHSGKPSWGVLTPHTACRSLWTFDTASNLSEACNHIHLSPQTGKYSLLSRLPPHIDTALVCLIPTAQFQHSLSGFWGDTWLIVVWIKAFCLDCASAVFNILQGISCTIVTVQLKLK